MNAKRQKREETKSTQKKLTFSKQDNVPRFCVGSSGNLFGVGDAEMPACMFEGEDRDGGMVGL
jgi:hypothetical protein